MLEEMLKNVREKSPLIHNITNYVTVNDCANVNLPSHITFSAVVPPYLYWLKLFCLYWFGLAVGFLVLRQAMLVVPNFFSRRAFGEEQQIGCYCRIGLKHTVWQSNDGVKVAVF